MLGLGVEAALGHLRRELVLLIEPAIGLATLESAQRAAGALPALAAALGAAHSLLQLDLARHAFAGQPRVSNRVRALVIDHRQERLGAGDAPWAGSSPIAPEDVICSTPGPPARRRGCLTLALT